MKARVPAPHRTVRTALGAIGLGLLPWLFVGCEPVPAGGAGESVTDYPRRPVTLISWVTPGGPTDLLARALAKTAPRYFGQRVTVLNKQGGSGAVAMGYLVQRSADGYTLAVTTSSGTISMAAGHVPFTPDDFTYIMRIQLDPFLMAVRSDSPFGDLTEFFAYARGNPGKLSVSGFGTTSAHFLAFSSLKAVAGNPDIRWIAYDGSADANVAALGGHTDAAHTNYSVVREYVRAGTMRVLGIASRISALPDVRTYAEQGYDVTPAHWRGLMGPKGMAPDLVVRVRELMEQTIRDPEFVEFMEATGTEYTLDESPEAFRRFVEDELRISRAELEKLNLVRSGAR